MTPAVELVQPPPLRLTAYCRKEAVVVELEGRTYALAVAVTINGDFVGMRSAGRCDVVKLDFAEQTAAALAAWVRAARGLSRGGRA